MFAGYLRPSLRRRVALALAATFVADYVVIAPALNVISRLWYSFHWFNRQGPNGGAFTPGLFSGAVSAGPFTTRTQILIVVLVLPALALTGWATRPAGCCGPCPRRRRPCASSARRTSANASG